jgi:hypothetical protein
MLNDKVLQISYLRKSCKVFPRSRCGNCATDLENSSVLSASKIDYWVVTFIMWLASKVIGEFTKRYQVEVVRRIGRFSADPRFHVGTVYAGQQPEPVGVE